MNKFFNRLSQVFSKSYGTDELYKFLLVTCMVFLIVNMFINNIYLRLIEIIIFTYAMYRVFSSNKSRRYKENEFYLNAKHKIQKQFTYFKQRFRDRNTYMYRKCPNCKKKLRLPLKKGKHTVKCPNCEHRFEVRCLRNEKIKVEIVK